MTKKLIRFLKKIDCEKNSAKLIEIKVQLTSFQVLRFFAFLLTDSFTTEGCVRIVF